MDPGTRHDPNATAQGDETHSQIGAPPSEPVPRRLSAGIRLVDRYRIEAPLGAGGMGEVYEAIDERSGRRVAVKTLRRLEGESLLLFKREFRAVADVQHPGLVGLGELACDDGVWFFTMELVRGVDWVTYARTGEAALRQALRGLGEALDALHRAGRVHRDIKPSNVLVDVNGRVVVLDFGIVHDLDAADTTHSNPAGVCGTPLYMAPEQAVGQSVTAAADYYAVGVMLYEALTGRLPIEGPMLLVLLEKQTVVPPSPRSLDPELPEDLSRLCMDLLAVDPGDRPRSWIGADQAVATDSSPPEVFVGRDLELAQLREAFEASSSRPVSVVIEGESGLGKSTLARSFVETLRGSGTLVLTSRCLDRENVPFKVLDGAIDSLARQLEKLPSVEARGLAPRARIIGDLLETFPVLRSVRAFAKAAPPTRRADVAEQRRFAFEALRELIERLGMIGPVVFVVDDVQWADRDSEVALEELLRPSEGPPALWIFTSRTANEPRVRAASPTGDVRQLALSGLDPSTAIALARALGCGDRYAEAIAREAAGHPMFVAELARSQEQDAVPSGVLSLDAALLRRLDSMADEVQRLVTVASLAISSLPIEVAFAAAGLEEANGRRAFASARDAALLRRSSAFGEALEPFHDRVRESVLERMPDGTRGSTHMALAVALDGTRHAKHRPDAYAEHLLGAGRVDEGRTELIRAARLAAGAAGFDAAVAAYERALALPRLDASETAVWLEELGHALNHAGRVVEASERLLEAASLGDAASKERCAYDAGLILLDTGDLARGRAVFTPILEAYGEAWPTRNLRFYLRLGLRMARATLWSVRAARSLEFAADEPVRGQEVERAKALLDISFRLLTTDPFLAGWFVVRSLEVAKRSNSPIAIGRASHMFHTFLTLGGLDDSRWRAIMARCRLDPTDAETRVLACYTAVSEALHRERGFETVVSSYRELVSAASSAPGRYHAQRRSAMMIAWWSGQSAGDFQLSQEVIATARDGHRRGNPQDVLWTATLTFLAYPSHGELAELDRLNRWIGETIPRNEREPFREFMELGYEILRRFADGDSVEGFARRLARQQRGELRFLNCGPMVWCMATIWGLLAAARRGEPTDPWLAIAKSLEAQVRTRRGTQPLTDLLIRWLGAIVLLFQGRRDAAIEQLREVIVLAQERRLDGVVLRTEHALGRLLGGGEGERLVREAERELRERGVRDPRADCMAFLSLPDDPLLREVTRGVAWRGRDEWAPEP